ncbi:MAG: hypothetical protein FWE18_00125 [Alphaproteobacteria bacterium]|nr:hypothetical protein [Alphaproteobacteria bacterium]
MSKSYTWINFSRNISTTQSIYEPTDNVYGNGFFFVAKHPTNGWTGAAADIRAAGVAGQIWRDVRTKTTTADICTLGDGVFVMVEDGSVAEINKKAYQTPNGLLTTDATFPDAQELNAWVVEENVILTLPDGTEIKGARIGFNSAL